MGGDRARPMSHPIRDIFVLLTLANVVVTICPVRCRCNDEALSASCDSANLDFLPIQLNPEVKLINLSDNKIATIDFLHNYNNLVSLDLSSNRVAKLGAGVFEYQRNLKYLNLSNNDLRNVSKDSLKGLRALVELDLSYNNLEELHKASFRELNSLSVLRLSNNQLTYLESGLLEVSNHLQELHLDNNQLLEVPYSALASVLMLRYLCLSNNLIDAVDEDHVPNLTHLKVLLLDGNVINEIHAGALSGLISLDILDLSDNNLTAVPTESLAKLSNLTKLKLSKNLIYSVPPVAFRGLFHLRYLHLDIQEVLRTIDSRAFVDNINLQRVWLDDNVAVESLPTRLFHGNPHVTHISVKNNQLTTLEATHFPLDQLKHLRLGGNPLECNCSLLWLWKLSHEQSKLKNRTDTLVLDSDEIRCAGPEKLKDVLIEEASESQMGCSVGLITTISAAASIFLVLGATATVLYYKFRCKERPEKAHEEPPACSNFVGLRGPYEDPRINKYAIGPPLIRDYPVIPPWDNPLPVDIYRQFDASKTRPHIVYV